jgi:oligoendopeptidase F
MLLSKCKKGLCLFMGFSMLNLSFLTAFSQSDIGQTKKPNYQKRSEIPASYKWKLAEIYANTGEWEKDYKKAEGLVNDFSKHMGKLGDSETAFEEAVKDFEVVSKILTKVYIYASLNFDVNMSNPDIQDLAGRATNLATLYSQKTSWFVPEINSLPKETIEKYLQSSKLSLYKVFIQDIVRASDHILSKEKEELLATISPMGLLPSESFRMLTKDIPYGNVKDDNNKDVELNPTTFIPLLQSENETTRKNAFKKYYETLNKFSDTFAKILSSSVKSDNIGAKIRNYESALQSSLYPNNIDVKVYDELINTVNKNLNLMHRYMDDKKKSINKEELHMYDIYLTTGAKPSNYIPYDEAKEIVLKALSPMGKEYTDVLRNGLNSNWVDVYSTSDKKPGGYQLGTFDLHPFILLNYQGTMEDVYTLAHELGHAMQSYYTNKKQPYIYSNYPIFTAEVASTLNETLLTIYLLKNSKSIEDKQYVINKNLEGYRSTLFRQTMFAEFEKILHQKDQEGETLNAKTLKQIYLDLNKKYYGQSMISDEEIAMEWARIPHFYNAFYVYQYATSFAASSALAKMVMEEGDTAVRRLIDNFLSAGSSAGPIEVLKSSGIDMSTSKPVMDTMKIFETVLTEFETIIDQTEENRKAQKIAYQKKQTGKLFDIEVNGSKIEIPEEQKMIINQRSFAYINDFLINMGAKIVTAPETFETTITFGKYTLIFAPDRDYAMSNNKKIILEQAPKLKSGKLLLPVRWVAETLGARVEWDNGTIGIWSK